MKKVYGQATLLHTHDVGNEPEYAKKKAAERSRSLIYKLVGTCSLCKGPVYFNTENGAVKCQECNAVKKESKDYGAVIPMVAE